MNKRILIDEITKVINFLLVVSANWAQHATQTANLPFSWVPQGQRFQLSFFPAIMIRSQWPSII